MLPVLAAFLANHGPTDEYGWCLPSTVDHWSEFGSGTACPAFTILHFHLATRPSTFGCCDLVCKGTNTRCCFGITPYDPSNPTALDVVGGVTVLDTFPGAYSDSASFMDRVVWQLKRTWSALTALGFTRYVCHPCPAVIPARPSPRCAACQASRSIACRIQRLAAV